MTGRKQPNAPKKVLDAEIFQRLNQDEAGFIQLASWLKKATGIHLPLNPKNLTLMAARLSKGMAQFHVKNYREFFRQLEAGDKELQKVFIEALTTNKSEFFREQQHFEFLPQALQNIIQGKEEQRMPREIRIWCAASSRGQEVYSILFTVLETGLNLQSWKLRFLASDIDKSVLEAASKGVFSEEDLRDVPAAILDKYFSLMQDSGSNRRFLVKEEYRSLITFAPFNLIQFPYAFQYKFDIIFCRNVLIYFDQDTIRQVKMQLAEALSPVGYLFIGHSETGSGRITELSAVESAIYKKTQEAS